MANNRAVLSGLCLLSIATAQGWAQEPATYRAQTELVRVALGVTPRDRATSPPPLSLSDLRVFEDGREVPPSALTRETEPVSVCVLLDSSGSMAEPGRRRYAQLVVDGLLEQLRPVDEVMVAAFDVGARVVVPWTTVSLRPTLDWSSWRTTSGTLIVDAFVGALGALDSASHRRRAIVIVSDGRGFPSEIPWDRVSKERRRSEVLVYGVLTERIGLEDSPSGLLAPAGTAGVNDASAPQLLAMVGDSGGLVVRARSDRSAREAARRVIDDLQTQYTLGYVPPTPPDGRTRRIRVETSRRDLSIRHRRAYVATVP